MRKAIILLSGGLDSATCLALAKSQGFSCYAMSFRYGQRSLLEVQAACNIAKHLQVEKHLIVELDTSYLAGSSLTDHQLTLPQGTNNTTEVPNTYVPARNTIFLSMALGWAESIGAHDIFYGANAVDYSGYSDCRPEYVQAFQNLANLATKAGISGNKITIHAPLLKLSKAQIINQGLALNIDFAQTISCYHCNEQGLACGKCESCLLRAQGFKQAGVADPTRYQSN